MCYYVIDIVQQLGMLPVSGGATIKKFTTVISENLVCKIDIINGLSFNIKKIIFVF